VVITRSITISGRSSQIIIRQSKNFYGSKKSSKEGSKKGSKESSKEGSKKGFKKEEIIVYTLSTYKNIRSWRMFLRLKPGWKKTAFCVIMAIHGTPISTIFF
jgi:hypothetical protein